MKRNYRTAFKQLEKIGAPVFENEDGMFISAEDNHDEIWADYWEMGQAACSLLDDFGVNHKINEILEKNGLYAEWQNPGCLYIAEG